MTSAYEALQEKKEEGTLIIVNCGGVPRSLTTLQTQVIGKGIVESQDPEKKWFDYILNEHFVRRLPSGSDRIEQTYADILALVEDAEEQAALSGRDLHEAPVAILTKNNPHHFTDREWERFATLCDASFISYRNPLLTTPSLVHVMIDSLREKAVKEESLEKYTQCQETHDFSSLTAEDFDPAPETQELVPFFTSGKADRDMANPILNKAYFQGKLLNHRSVDASLLTEISTKISYSLPEELTTNEKTVDVLELPEPLREHTQFHRLGWNSIEPMVEACRKTGKPLILYDAHDLQMAPKAFQALVERSFDSIGLTENAERKGVIISNKGRTGGESVFFSDALHSTDVRPPTHSVEGPENIPFFLRDYTENQAMSAYQRLSNHPARWVPPLAKEHFEAHAATDPFWACLRLSRSSNPQDQLLKDQLISEAGEDVRPLLEQTIHNAQHTEQQTQKGRF